MSPKIGPKMETKKRLRFTLEVYRKTLKAWKVTDDSTVGSDRRSRSDPKVANNNSNDKHLGTEDKTDHQMAKTESTGDETIELLDTSLDEIPETPEFARKTTKSKPKRKTNKKSICPFIDFEAEDAMDSMDSFDNDIENTEKELNIYTQSLIDNSTQIDTKDMESVYLQSVKDRIGKCDKYKLQFGFDPTVDVFSQQPTEEELEDYEFDSFCVPNDSVVFEESAPVVSELSIESPIDPRKRSKRLRPNKKKFKRIIFSP